MNKTQPHQIVVSWCDQPVVCEEAGMDVSMSDRDRFVEKVADPTPGKCWEWDGSHNKDGYGMYRCDGQMRLAHRVAYTIWWGAIPEGKYVMHRCDNPGCVNPDHLMVGSQLDNMRDSKAKRRNAYGESAGNSKVTAKDVIRIRALWATGLIKQVEIAMIFGVSAVNVHHIVTGRTWELADGKIVPPRPAKKVTHDQVAEIHRLLDEGDLTQMEIAARFGIKQPHVSRIKRGIARAV